MRKSATVASEVEAAVVPGPASDSTESAAIDVPDWLLALLSWLWVLPQAWDGWSTVHRKPHHAFVCSMLAGFAALCLNIWILGVSIQPVRLNHMIPFSVYVTCHLTALLLVWRHGPPTTKTNFRNAAYGVSALLHAYMTVRLMIGPVGHMPFADRLVYTCSNAAVTWMWFMASLLGCWASDIPPEPHRYTASLQHIGNTTPSLM